MPYAVLRDVPSSDDAAESVGLWGAGRARQCCWSVLGSAATVLEGTGTAYTADFSPSLPTRSWSPSTVSDSPCGWSGRFDRPISWPGRS